MSQVEQEQRYGGDRVGRRGFVAGATEARPGLITTEFWLSVLAAIGIVIAGYVSDTFDNDLAWALGAGLIAAYTLSRGLAKCGSREGPFVISTERDGNDVRTADSRA
jgi:hypothetical protein